MSDHNSAIVADVHRAVEAVNSVVLVLQIDHPLYSDILDVNYSQETVGRFVTSSQAVIDCLHSASLTASNWLEETGDCLSRNINEAGQIERSISDTAASLAEADAHTRATQSRIDVLDETIRAGEANYSSAQSALWRAEDKLDNKRAARNALCVASVVTFFFAPVVSFSLAAINIVALEAAVDRCKDTVHTIEAQLALSRSEVQSQRASLASERDESTRLSTTISQLRERGERLAAEKQRLEHTHCDLAILSTRINDCLHTVNASLSSSKTISTMSSMRNVVSGI